LDLRRFEKTDIHRHLEGCIRPATAWELARGNGLLDPGVDLATFREQLVIAAPIPLFEALDRFDRFRAPIVGHAAINRIVHEAIEDAAADHVTRLELRFSPLTLARSSGVGMGELFELIEASARQASAHFGMVAVSLVVVISRRRGHEGAWQVVQALQSHGRGRIAGVDFASDELRHRSAEFHEVAQALVDLGLPLTVHTGEGVGPEHVAEALALPGVRRLGHALSLVDDPDLIADVIDRHITIEVCPTSNHRAGVLDRLHNHPVRKMAAAGVPFVLCADDPTLFDITLTDELQLARQTLQLTDQTLLSAEERARQAMFHSP